MPQTLPQESEPTLKRLVDLGVVEPDMAWTPVLEGTINTVWRARLPGGEPAFVRIGPGSDTVARGPSWMRSGALACEAIVLDRLGAVIDGLPTPVAAGFLRPERPWLVQRLVPGQQFSEVISTLGPHERAEIWRQLGERLRRVHEPSAPWFGTPDGHHVFPDWVEMVRWDAEGMLADAHRYGLDPSPFERLIAMVERYAEVLGEIERPTIVHSDLFPRHIFVRRNDRGDWEISGVIDWEYARYVDPLSESLIVDMLARPEDDPDRIAWLEGYGLDDRDLSDPGFWQRQEIYRDIANGWALTDSERLARAKR